METRISFFLRTEIIGSQLQKLINIKVKIINGSHIGNIALIPRIELTPSETSLLFRMSRRQFPTTFFQPHKIHNFILIEQLIIVFNTSLSIT